ncbi:MAG: type II secretion system F family protein [Candidatus Omnitrophica bacterium]|nr:type II secretion system F family protein [Candidatus Omnitrophota bacterium]MCM8829173.1 type II secretion system F family protein [Candidatus Omnitrophota bacterium]
MPVFSYEGFDRKGRRVSGRVEAESDTAARMIVKSRGIFIKKLLSLERHTRIGREKVKKEELALSIRELATLLNSGLTLDESVSGIIEQARRGRLKDVYTDIQKQIREGKSFSKAASQYPDLFSDISLSMIRSGEASGTLGLVLDHIATFMEESIRFRNRVSGIMTYPIMMAVVGFLVLTFVFTFVTPTMTRIFSEISLRLPLPTIFLIKVSSFIKQYILAMLVIGLIVVYSGIRYFSSEKGKAKISTIRKRIPYLGEIFFKSEVANFTGTLGILLEGGVEILTSFSIAREVLSSPDLKQQIDRAKDLISHGQSVSSALRKTTVLPYTVIQLISAGERSGTMSEMLIKVSANFKEEVSQRATKFVTILEPLMILFMAIVVGFVVIGIMLPIFQISQSLR